MDHIDLSKELAPRPLPAVRSKPTFVVLANQQLSSTGKWNADLAIDYIRVHGRDRYITVGELAKVFYHANIPRNKKRVRRCLTLLHKRLVSCRELLVRETDATTRRVIAVKLYDPRSEKERQSIHDDLERMRARREINDATYGLYVMLLQHKEAQLLNGSPA